MEKILTLKNISKHFGGTKVINGMDLTINKGEVFTLLGPSGCGKSTTMRIIAGMENPDEGEVIFNGKTWVAVSQNINVPPHKRNIGLVFQNYAIWPHMTVFENIAYPLRVRNENKIVIKEKVDEVIHLVGLKGFEDRPAPMLSGGQQQRVALARALVYDPSLLLLDEPFSNLDARLREKMRLEIKLLQEKLGLTILLVTHDYLDAFSLSDRIGVLYNGKFEQIDDVKQIYEKPRTPFVRDFIGKTVLIDGVVKAVENRICKVELSNKSIIELNLDEDKSFQTGEPVTVCIRPDDIRAVTDTATPNSIPFHIKTSIFLGERYECLVQMDEHTQIVFYLPRMSNPRPNEIIQLYFDPALLSVWRHENV